MGSSERDKSSKEAKEPKTPTQEPTSSTPPGTGNPEWPGFQAYSAMPPHGYMASSPQAPHPYMWGVQPMMPPYGTPPHPYMVYPHGGMYAHPSMPPGSYPFSPFAMPSPNGAAEASGNTPNSTEADGKGPEGKEKLPIKRSKGSLGSLNMITGKNNEGGKASGASADGVHSKSADTPSDGSSEGSDANSDNDSPMKSGGRQDSLEGEAASQNGGSAIRNGGTPSPTVMNQSMAVVPKPVPGIPGGPTTNLNIGMDYWGNPTPPALPAVRGKISPSPVAGGMVTAGSRESLQSQLWLQDERELKRQRRKQSNRESARRSRLRKQAECDELAQRAEVLKDDNSNLRSELNRIRTEYEQLLAQNASLKERLGEIPGQDDPRPNANDAQQNEQT